MEMINDIYRQMTVYAGVIHSILLKGMLSRIRTAFCVRSEGSKKIWYFVRISDWIKKFGSMSINLY